MSRYLALDHSRPASRHVHRTDAAYVAVYSGDPADLAPEERAYRQRGAAWCATEGAYIAMQGNKPQTPPQFKLTDPSRRARRLDRGETPHLGATTTTTFEQSFTKDEILTNITIYWLTSTIGSSMRMYHANDQIPAAQLTSKVQGPLRPSSLFAVYDIHHPPRAPPRTNRQPRPPHREPLPRRPLRRLRRARTLRRRTACVLPPLPNPSTLKAALPQPFPRSTASRWNEVHDAADVLRLSACPRTPG